MFYNMCPASIPALASTKHAALLGLSDDGKQVLRAYRNICIKQKQFAKDPMFKRNYNVTSDFFVARLPSSCESVLCSSSSQPSDYKSNLKQYDSEASHFASAENIAINAPMNSRLINESLHSSYSNISNDTRDTVQDINSLKYPNMLVYDTVSCSPQKFNSSLNSHKNELFDSDSLFRPGQNLDKEMTISLNDTVSKPNIFETCDDNLFQKQQVSEATSELCFTKPGGSKLYSSSSKSKNDLALQSFTENNSEKRNPDISDLECAEAIVPAEISCNIHFSLGFGSQLEYSLDHSKADVDET